MSFPKLNISLPDWLDSAIKNLSFEGRNIEGRMQFVLKLAELNITNNGGPFAAAIFEAETGKLVAPGVNLVVQSNCSLAHAEVVAIAIAQQKLGAFDLGSDKKRYELVTSAEPCVQCFGAALWSGIASLVCGARTSDVEAIGFDEGPKPQNWPSELTKRGISLKTDVLRDQAIEILTRYQQQDGVIYMPLKN